MLKFPCLVLDHDDTVVKSEETVNYPFFCRILEQLRPGAHISLRDYTLGCYNPGFSAMCKIKYHFTDQELHDEYAGWMNYLKTHIPAPFPGIKEIIYKQKEMGGRLCVISHSSQENITRDYLTHFGIEPDVIYGWDYPEDQRKPNPYPLKQIMSRYGYPPEEILVIDDMRPAYEMCRSAGVAIGYAGWSHQNCPEIAAEMQSLCDYSFLSTEKLYQFLY